MYLSDNIGFIYASLGHIVKINQVTIIYYWLNLLYRTFPTYFPSIADFILYFFYVFPDGNVCKVAAIIKCVASASPELTNRRGQG